MRSSAIQVLSFLASVSSVLNLVAASNVIDLTPANFDEIVGSGKPALVRFIQKYLKLMSRLNFSLLGIWLPAQLLMVRCGHWYPVSVARLML